MMYRCSYGSSAANTILVNDVPFREKESHFRRWAHEHTVRIGGVLQDRPQLLLFVHRALHDFDPGMDIWSAEFAHPLGTQTIVKRGDGTYLYDGDKLSVTPKAASPKAASSSKAAASSRADHSILVCTYNCLYSRATGSLCGWDTEMIDRTEHYGPRVVKSKNLYWKVRSKRLASTIMEDGPPDVLMLQEVTPRMLKSLLALTGLANYRHAVSEVGCCESEDGYAHVLLNPDVFRVLATTTSMGDDFTRACIVRAEHVSTGFFYVFASCHLPSRKGVTRCVNAITDGITSMRVVGDHVVVGGDFNVEVNPFRGLKNISGKQLTFANDEDLQLDWIVASSNVQAVGPPIVHVVDPSHDRWPNDVEGSDHTAVKVHIQAKGKAPAPAKGRSVSGTGSELDPIQL